MQLENFLQPNWSAPANVQALMTVKYDAPLNPRPIITLPTPALWIKQEHTTNCVRLPLTEVPVADATITCQKQIICAVATADCLPLLFCEQQGREVGAIHAGWRGLAKGVIQESLKKLTYDIKDYLFWLGPCISEHSFEVESDVLEYFTQFNWAPKLLQQAFREHKDKPTKFLGNLRLLAKDVLLQAGALESKITISDLCTYRDHTLFHSYRRDKTRERMRSIILIKD